MGEEGNYAVQLGPTRDQSLLHVVARKQGNPPIYYYRQWINRFRWTAWTKIDLDIISDHVLPVVWNRRLYLFWAIINKKADEVQNFPKMQFSDDLPSPVNKHLEIQLAWSEYKGNKWLPKQTSPQTISIKGDIEPHQVTLKSTIDGQFLRLDIFLEQKQHSQFALGGIGNAVEAFVLNKKELEGIGPDTRNIGELVGWDIGELNQPKFSKYEAMAIVPKELRDLLPKEQRLRVSYCWVTYEYSNQSTDECIMDQADLYRLLVPHQFKNFDSSLPFFYEDSKRSYLIIRLSKGYILTPFYHAFVPLFIRELNRGGVDALFSRDLQIDPDTIQTEIQGTSAFDGDAFKAYYLPANIVQAYPSEVVEFDKEPYAIYNWELFFHTPFLIGETLSHNQQFEDSKHWYEYIFNPNNGFGDVPNCYWVTKPFYKRNDYLAESIRNLMNLTNKNNQDTVAMVEDWKDYPFDPHIIAQSRQTAYQRAIVMKYIDNLIAWGDQLFSQNTMESINEATEMYVLASELLGPRPQLVKPLVMPPDKTYAELDKEGLDTFSNASILAAENLLGTIQSTTNYGNYNRSASGSLQSIGSADSDNPQFPVFPTLYFNIPPNYQLLGYWDKVADRLFKIRHCMNIEGTKRQLAMFAPPIDPGLLVKATAAGLDLGSILSDSSAALPPYRFRVMLQEAIELCEMVRGFGNELLAVLEKCDAEALALKRSGLEKKLQDQIRDVLQKRLDEEIQQIDVLVKQRQIIIDRQSFYNQRKDELTNVFEAAALVAQGLSMISDSVSIILESSSGAAHTAPEGQMGGSGGGGSPHATAKWGGPNIGRAADSWAKASRIASAILHTSAQMSQTIGSYQRRKEDWELQYTLATDELNANDSQSLAASIRKDIAQMELDNHNTNIELATEVDDFLHSKYTNQDLYKWMIAQTSATYFQAYQLAYTLAKRAEQCFRRELGLSDSSYIQFGYWDSLKKGLLAGDKLLFDLQRLKSAYYAQNARELELTKHISLLAIDPYSLVELRSKGECMVMLPEILFDLENPGHYMRRIKSVGITVPCVVGPYTNVSMTLTLLDNHVRISPDSSPDSNDYVLYPDIKNPERFVDDQGGVSAIVTSNAMNDRGMFEFKFDDERYLPFECAGAISSWKLQLNPVYPQFDYSTISDVIIHFQYTARDGGEVLKKNARDSVISKLNDFALKYRKGLYLLISSRHEFGSSWQKFLKTESGKDQILTFNITPDQFPFFTNGLNIAIKGIDFAAKLSDSYTLAVTPPGGNKKTGTMEKDKEVLGYMHHCCIDGSSKPSPLGQIDLGNILAPNQNLTWSFQFQKNDKLVTLSASDIDDLLLVIHYEVQEPKKL